MPTKKIYNSNGYSDEQINTVFDLKATKLSTGEISNETGLTKNAISHILSYYKEKHAKRWAKGRKKSEAPVETQDYLEKVSTEPVRLKKITLSDGLDLLIDFNKADERRLVAIIDLMADNGN